MSFPKIVVEWMSSEFDMFAPGLTPSKCHRDVIYIDSIPKVLQTLLHAKQVRTPRLHPTIPDLNSSRIFAELT